MHPVILAAGRGSRLEDVTADRPTLFVDVDRHSIYEHQLEVLESQFDERHRDDGYTAVGCVRGHQDEMTAVRFGETAEITAYGDITGHRGTGTFVLHASHRDAARRLLAANEESWFPFVFELLPSGRVVIPGWSHHQINTPAHLEQAPARLPFEPFAADRNPPQG